MQGDKTLKTHEALMDRMARTLGADLDEAELRGELAPEIRHAMLLSCTGCSDPAGCPQRSYSPASSTSTVTMSPGRSPSCPRR
jgi:hypothetical protein